MDEPFVFFKKFCSAFFSFFFLNLSEKHICQWLIKKYFSLQTHKHQKLSADVNMLWMCYFDAPWLFFWPPLWTITHIWEWMCCKACHGGGIWSFLLSWIQIKAKNVRQHPEHKKEYLGRSQVPIKSKEIWERAGTERRYQGSLQWSEHSGLWSTGHSRPLDQHPRFLQKTTVLGTAPTQASGRGPGASGIRDADKSQDNCSLTEGVHRRRNSCSALLFVREIWWYNISSIIHPWLLRKGLFLLVCHYHAVKGQSVNIAHLERAARTQQFHSFYQLCSGPPSLAPFFFLRPKCYTCWPIGSAAAQTQRTCQEL